MKKITKALMAAGALGLAILQAPGVSDAISALIAAHPKSALSAAIALLLGALKHNPNAAQSA